MGRPPKIVHILHKSNPWAEGLCGRKSCLPCDTGDLKCCFKRNIVYKSSCVLCRKEGKESVYIGESSRSSHERGAEHLDDYNKSKQDSHMRKHTETDHPQESEHNFEFKVMQSFKSALMRQLTEAVLIRRQAGTVLNSKGVYNRCHLPRLTVENGTKKEEEAAGSSNIKDKSIEDWGQWQDKKSKKRFTHPQRETQVPKRIKLDQKQIHLENPRLEGVSKRKNFQSKSEFVQNCKRFRPSFNPEEELEREKEFQNREPTTPRGSSKQQQISFFPIFTKTNQKLKNEKPNTKSKPKFCSRSKRKDKSLISSGGDSNYLRKWLIPKQAAGSIEPISTNPSNHGVNRVGESEVTWGSALKEERGTGLLSTSSSQFNISSDQVVLNNERSLD